MKRALVHLPAFIGMAAGLFLIRYGYVSHTRAVVVRKVVRETLYRFGQGMKVAVEVAIMAAEADLLDLAQEAIAVAGTGEGADTALVVQPACALHFKRFRIREILAKPR